MANRLIQETSPYLLQHAHNPVDWYPWGDEPFQRARAEDRPLLVSIGYSACHWCHVMERESFENEDTARLMNRDFICVKVDREEHPDVDSVYMEAVQAMTGRGGWPLTVFLTPDGRPFFGGTYFPPDDSHGLPGFRRVLQTVADAYRNRRPLVMDAAQQVLSSVGQVSGPDAAGRTLNADILQSAYRALAGTFDASNGGFGMAPKFPQPMAHEFLLRWHHRTGEPQALSMVESTLDRMASGGIYDQVGGGFHRYSTDGRWLVPHFEKMLYDNALLSRLYLHAYQVTGNPRYRRVAEETLDYVLREMTGPAGEFHSAQDADIEGEEGRYYVWTARDFSEALDKEDARLMLQYFGVTDEGNFEGKNVLHVPADLSVFSASLAADAEEIAAVVDRSKRRLLAAREQRGRPNRDEKALTSWNAMMLHGFAEAAGILGRDDYRRAAIAGAAFLLREVRQGDLLLHTYRDGQAKIPGYLDDYALLVDALLAVHEATFEQRWLEEAVQLAGRMTQRFADASGDGLLYDTAGDHHALFVRPRDVVDSVKPCGNSAAAGALLRLARITGDKSHEEHGVALLSRMTDQMADHPLGFGNWLCALDFHLSVPTEIAIVGPYGDPATQALLHVVHRRYRPNSVLVGLQPPESPAPGAAALLQDRTMLDGRPTAYVCYGYSCQQPTTDAAALEGQLTSSPAGGAASP
ncbi:MAG: thioredoxin domain-containing protein [Chloroflexota bacterium]|nr:thioredoxin domain-containing protein [Chloroflexota bacterium]